MEKVGIGISTYKRTKYLVHIITEMIRTKVDLKDVFFFVDGNDENSDFLIQVRKHQRLHNYKVVTNPWSGHRGNFTNIGNYFKEHGYKYFFYIEDDTTFSKNWLPFSLKILEELKGPTFGVLAVYCGHSHKRAPKVRRSVHEYNGALPFYGSCAWLLSVGLFDEIVEKMKENENPDTAVGKLKMGGTLYRVFVVTPNIAQHLGAGESAILPDIPMHRSHDFYGHLNDAMGLL